MRLTASADAPLSLREDGCRACGGQFSWNDLDLGDLPPCNRFTLDAPTEERRLLRVRQCAACGLIQLQDDTPVAFVRPRVSWITYNEPDQHLVQVADILTACIGRHATAAGTGPFDVPLLRALADRGLATAELALSPGTDPSIGGYPYLETFQQALRPHSAAAVAASRIVSDIVISRYILEHSHDPVTSLQALRSLAAVDGYVVVEVPDSSKFLARNDYSFLWEEHVCYFTEETLRSLAYAAGLGVQAILRFEGQLEDALVAILRPQLAGEPASPETGDHAHDSAVFPAYAANFGGISRRVDDRLSELTAGKGNAAMVGMGHQAVMFLNAHGVQHHFRYLVDDHPDKQRHFVPGTSQRIVATPTLLQQEDLSVCVLAMSPRVEPKVLQKLEPLAWRGVQFFSIFNGGGLQTLISGGE